MQHDMWSLYPLMLRSRLFEEAIAKLWHDGLISGEMHLGTGEEAIIAGIIPQLRDGDAMALDHRGTSALLMRGVDPKAVLNELLGRSIGLCSGYGKRIMWWSGWAYASLFKRTHCCILRHCWSVWTMCDWIRIISAIFESRSNRSCLFRRRCDE